MNLKKLIESRNLNLENIYIYSDSGENLNDNLAGFELNPEDFLDFAENDLKSNNTHGYVNALSNAKRAIDCRVDKLLIIFGINPKNWYFPQKIEYLKDVGVIAPRIVEKVNRNRNYLEHNYKCPDKEKAYDAVDIASLFVESINNKLSTIWTDILLIDEVTDSRIRITFEKSEFFFKIQYSDNEDDIIIDKSNKNEYKTLLKLIISNNWTSDNKGLIKELLF